jgi:hypothetical protein
LSPVPLDRTAEALVERGRGGPSEQGLHMRKIGGAGALEGTLGQGPKCRLDLSPHEGRDPIRDVSNRIKPAGPTSLAALTALVFGGPRPPAQLRRSGGPRTPTNAASPMLSLGTRTAKVTHRRLRSPARLNASVATARSSNSIPDRSQISSNE